MELVVTDGTLSDPPAPAAPVTYWMEKVAVGTTSQNAQAEEATETPPAKVMVELSDESSAVVMGDV